MIDSNCFLMDMKLKYNDQEMSHSPAALLWYLKKTFCGNLDDPFKALVSFHYILFTKLYQP